MVPYDPVEQTRKLVRVLWMSPFARANLVAAVRELEAGGQVDPFAAFGDEGRGQVDSTPRRWEPARTGSGLMRMAVA